MFQPFLFQLSVKLLLLSSLANADNFQPCLKNIRPNETYLIAQSFCDQSGTLRLFKSVFPGNREQPAEVFELDKNEKLIRYSSYSIEGTKTSDLIYEVQKDGTYLTRVQKRPQYRYEVTLFPSFEVKKLQSWNYDKNNRLQFVEDFRNTTVETYPRKILIYDESEKLKWDYELEFRNNDRNITIVSRFQVKDAKGKFLGNYDENQEARPNASEAAYEPVVIIDTGFDLNHKSIQNQFASDFWGLYDDVAFGRSLSKNISDSLVLSVNRQPAFPFSHGTHVASIAMQDIKTMKAVGFAGDFSDVEFLRKISEYIQTHKIAFVNMSFGFGERGNPFGANDKARYAILRLMSDNPETLFIIAAGNGKQMVTRDMESDWPAGAPVANKLVVAATANSDFKSVNFEKAMLASFSNYGDEVDLAAPGDEVLGANVGGSFVAMSGTSMAAPLVMNVAMKVKEINPKLTAMQIKKILLESVIVPNQPLPIKTRGVLSPQEALKKAIQSRSQL